MLEITKGSDLLSKKQIEALDAKALAAYEKSASAFADSFNQAHPTGKKVVATIKQIKTQESRVLFVLAQNNDLSTTVISLPYVVTDAMSESIGVGTTEGLVSLQQVSLQPLKFEMHIKAVKPGDTYMTNENEEREYTIFNMARVPNTREELVVSQDAKTVIAEAHRENLKSVIASATKKTSRKTAAVVTAEPIEEAEV